MGLAVSPPNDELLICNRPHALDLGPPHPCQAVTLSGSRRQCSCLTKKPGHLLGVSSLSPRAISS